MKCDVSKEGVASRLLSLSLLLAGCLVSLGRAENSVHILSKYGRNQLVTSTTLKWVHGEYPQTSFPPNLVIGAHQYNLVESNEAMQEKRKGQPIYVCRARHAGVWLVGSLSSGERCTVVGVGRVYLDEKYELLENQEGAARLSWVPWSKFSGVKTGAVSIGERETYVARRLADKAEADNMPAAVTGTDVYFLGKLDTREGLGRISVINQTGQEEHHVDGEILVEMEPTFYELTISKFNQRRKYISRQPRTLGYATLINEVNQVASKVDSVITYDTNYSLYWGQGQAILTGLPTSIILPNGTLYEKIKWGIQEMQLRKEVFRIEALLEPNTGVNVTLRGNFTDSSVPYSGELVAVYEDKGVRQRPIQGVRKETAMLDVVAEYGPVYFLHNFTLVPTTTTTTTTTSLPPTTTTIATTEILEPTTKKPIENETKQIENNAMFSDESGAKKNEAASTGRGDSSKASISNVSMVNLFYLSLAILCVNAVIF